MDFIEQIANAKPFKEYEGRPSRVTDPLKPCGYCDCRRPEGHSGMHWRPAYAVFRHRDTPVRQRPADAIWSKEDELIERMLSLATCYRPQYSTDRRIDMLKALKDYLAGT